MNTVILLVKGYKKIDLTASSQLPIKYYATETFVFLQKIIFAIVHKTIPIGTTCLLSVFAADYGTITGITSKKGVSLIGDAC